MNRKKLKRLQGKVSGPGQAEKIIVKGERRGREGEEVEKMKEEEEKWEEKKKREKKNVEKMKGEEEKWEEKKKGEKVLD